MYPCDLDELGWRQLHISGLQFISNPLTPIFGFLFTFRHKEIRPVSYAEEPGKTSLLCFCQTEETTV